MSKDWSAPRSSLPQRPDQERNVGLPKKPRPAENTLPTTLEAARLACIAADTLVTMYDGIACPIQNVCAPAAVACYDVSKGGICHAATQGRAVSRGRRKVVRLTFVDGRTLTCTPDHRLLLDDFTWCEAALVPILGARVLLGARGVSASCGDDHMYSSQTALGYHHGPGNLAETSYGRSRARILALARLSGTVAGQSSAATLILSCSVDRDSVMRDCETVGSGCPGGHPGVAFECIVSNKSVRQEETTGTEYHVTLLPEVHLAAVALHRALGGCKFVATAVPASKTSASPRPSYVGDFFAEIVREYLAAFFGGGGAGIGPALNESGRVFQPVSFHVCRGIEENTHRINAPQLCALLSRVGVAAIVKKIERGSHRDVRCSLAPANLAANKDTSQLHETQGKPQRQPKGNAYYGDDVEEIVVAADQAASNAFAERIGARHAQRTSQKLGVLADWAIHVDAWKHAILPSTLMQRNPVAMTAAQYVEALGALFLFPSTPSLAAETSPRRSNQNVVDAVPALATIKCTLGLQLAARRRAGRTHVFDVGVYHHHNFLANGMVVHNCFEAETRLLVCRSGKRFGASKLCILEGQTFRKCHEDVASTLSAMGYNEPSLSHTQRIMVLKETWRLLQEAWRREGMPELTDMLEQSETDNLHFERTS